MIRESAGLETARSGPAEGAPRDRRLIGVGGALRSVGRQPGLLAVVSLGVMLAVDAALEPATIGRIGLDFTALAAAPVVFATLAQMILILGGDIDLGIGYSVGLINVIAATALVAHPAVGAGLLICVVGGYVGMGAWIHVRRLPTLVVTLGMSFVWLGIGLLAQSAPGGSCPGWLSDALNASTPLLPEPIWIILGAALAGNVLIFHSGIGRVWRAFGNNKKTLDEAGWSGMRVRLMLFALAGVCVMLSGLFVTVSTGASDISASSGDTLTSVAAVIFGGATFSGGEAYPVGAVAGAAALSVMATFLSVLNVPGYYELAITGAILMLAVALRVVLNRGHLSSTV